MSKGPASEARPRIAVLSPYLPAPTDTGGRIRIHRLCTALAQTATLDLFARASQSEILQHQHHPALSVFNHCHFSSRPLSWARHPLSSHRVRDASPPSLRLTLALALARGTYDFVFACHSTSVALLPPWWKGFIALDEHNIESRFAASTDPDPREHQRLSRWEFRVWPRASVITTVSADDKAIISPHARSVTVIPNGTDSDSIPFIPPSLRTGSTLLFIASMAHRPNADAARWLALEVFPRVKKIHPNASLVLCGRDPDASVLSLSRDDITVTGTVPDVRPFLATASVYVNPLHSGAGTSLKVAEALAAGVPLVSTSTGIRGYQSPASFASICDTPEHFANAIVSILDAPARFDPGAHTGRLLAETLSWPAVSTHFRNTIFSRWSSQPELLQ